jgi:hypothetical protein
MGREYMKDFQEVGVGCGDWIESAQDRGKVAGNGKYGKEPSGSIKNGKFLD